VQKSNRRAFVVLLMAVMLASALTLLVLPSAWANDPAGVDTAPAAGTQPAPSVAPQGDPQTFFAVDVRNFELLTITSAAPQTPTILGGFADSIFGGDFISDSYDLLYALNNTTDEFITIDTTTGTPATIGSLGEPVGGGTWSGLAWDQTTSTLYASSAAASGATLYTINLTTGAPTVIGSVTGLTVLIDIAIHPTTGVLYGIDTSTDNLYTIDKATAASTLVGALNYPANFAQGMDFDDDNGVLYWAAYQGAAVGPGSIRTIDLATGASTELGIIGDGSLIRELDGFAWIAPETPTAVTLADLNATESASPLMFIGAALVLVGIVTLSRKRS
jgi:hypothetical protein